jgi:hypothetical protein
MTTTDAAITTANMAKDSAAAIGSAGLVFLGIPQAILVASFAGALLSLYFRKSEPESLKRTVIGIIAVAFAAAWVTVILPHWKYTNSLSAIPPEALAGGIALSFNFIRRVAGAAIEKWAMKKAEETT